MSEFAAWVNTVGLIADLIGVWVVGSAVIEREDTSIDNGQARWSSESRDHNRKLPLVEDRIRASRRAIVGGVLFSVGIALQCASTWMQSRG